MTELKATYGRHCHVPHHVCPVVVSCSAASMGCYAAVIGIFHSQRAKQALTDFMKRHGQAKHTQVSICCCREIQAIVYEMPVGPYPGSGNIHWSTSTCSFLPAHPLEPARKAPIPRQDQLHHLLLWRENSMARAATWIQ